MDKIPNVVLNCPEKSMKDKLSVRNHGEGLIKGTNIIADWT